MKMPKLIWLIVLFVSFKQASAQDYATGMIFDDAAYLKTPQQATLTRALTDVLPDKASLKMYAPYPKTQSQYGTCVAWSSAYCGRTMVDAIKYNWTDRDSITKHAYSPAFLYRLIKPNDGGCNQGAVIDYAFEAMKKSGSIHFDNLPTLCVPSVSPSDITLASASRLRDYSRLFSPEASANVKIQAVKHAIFEKKPVVIGMQVPPSFKKAKGCWTPIEPANAAYPGHAMCVVGYDDTQYGGAFEIQNSWGAEWGNLGYIWVKYADFASFVSYADQFLDLPDIKSGEPDLSGSIKLVLANGQQMNTNLITATNPNSQPLTIYKTATPYTTGTRFRINISNNQPAYVYAIASDLTNAVTKIFPYADNISAALTYKRNEVAYPSEDTYIEMDDQPGTDFLCVLYSRSELDINDIIAKIGTKTGTFNQRVNSVLGSRIVAPASIKFSTANIAFNGKSSDKDVVALMVELEHKK